MLILAQNFIACSTHRYFHQMGNSHAKSFGQDAINVLTKQVEGIPRNQSGRDIAMFAGGCFWGIQLTFQRVPGVLFSEVGYTQGHLRNPTYEDVCSGTSGHTEAIRIEFDPHCITYAELLTVFWDRIDPTTLNRQGNDIGSQYRSGIYYLNEEQRNIAISSKENEQLKYSSPIATEILPAKEWFRAEDYHQRYLEKGGQCARLGDTTPIRCYG